MKPTDPLRIGKALFCLLFIGSLLQPCAAETFVPGSGGSLPAFTEFQAIQGHVAGFFVQSSIRRSDTWGTGTNAEINMSFPDAATYGVGSLTLQYKTTSGTWANYQYDGKDLSTTGNNFSINVDQTYIFRLLLNGGTQNGFVSNEQTAYVSVVNTYFSQVTLDESMFLSGVMAPWVGRGLQASFAVKKTSDNTEVNGGLTIQWYRVNPATFEMTPIIGADSLTYITTMADIGYKLLVKGTGDQTTVGGFYQMMSNSSTVCSNKCFVSNPTTSGFILNLYQDAVKLDTADFDLRDKEWSKVPITAIAKSKTNGVFQVTAPLSLDKNPYSLQSKTTFWKICTAMEFGQMSHLMEGVNIDLTTSSIPETVRESALNICFDASSKTMKFQSVSNVNRIFLYRLTGSLVGSWNTRAPEGELSLTAVPSGGYVVRFETEKGCVVRKLMVTN